MWDSTFQLMSWWKTNEVGNATVMVVGAGALGNEVLKNLALLGVGHIIIVDFDKVEYSNLNRSILFRKEDSIQHAYKAHVVAQRIEEINPNIKVETIIGDITIDVGLGVFRRVNVVIGCLDNRLARLYLNRLCYKVGTTWIDGAIENLAGELTVYNPQKSCYECELSPKEWDNIRVKLGCPDIAKRNISYGRIPTTPISASIIAAIQVQEALKIIHGNEKQSIAGQKFYYEGMNMTVLQYPCDAPKEDCMSHFQYEDIIEASALSTSTSIHEALRWLSKHFGEANPTIELDHEFVLELTAEKSEEVFHITKPKPHLSNEYLDSLAAQEETLFITKSVSYIDKTFPMSHLSLQEIGIPSLHIIQVNANEETYFVELTGDKASMGFS